MTVETVLSPGRCRSCRAAIVWVKTRRGKNLPLDPEPTQDGNVLVHFPLRSGPVADVLKDDGHLAAMRAQRVPLYTSHFKTCPDAGKWRNRKAGR
ncbi:hypothetical protein [Rhodococcus pyridinivorans]|uniref:Uncharacterized protein n=1 Tax=Rhodococcus pyridinivorans TaxID=103816 RepID=A0A7M2XRL5_9NOCA|nr:hypothetical protein [Rhodococcus pyridinivorans]QOV99541.1 hypothetical protein INP59_03830 [Rhodococcus pyridinivorans]